MSDQDNLALARSMGEEMEADGTWAELREQVARQFPDRHHERRFIMVRSDGVPAPVLMLRGEPWTEELAEHWMAYVWEAQRVGGFSVQITPGEATGGKQQASMTISGSEMGVSLAFIVDLESGQFFRGARERTPEEAARIAMQHYMAVMLPPGAVEIE